MDRHANFQNNATYQALEGLHLNGARDDHVLVEAPFELASISPPPRYVEPIDHRFEHHHLIPVHLTVLTLPEPGGRRSHVRGDAAELGGELATDLRKLLVGKVPAFVVIDRQQQLHQMHAYRLPSSARIT